MKILKVPLIAAAVLALGFAFCPAPPGAGRIDPKELLRKALHAEINANYRARRLYTSAAYGRTYESRSWFPPTSNLPPPTSDFRTSLIEKNYTPLVEGEDTIAGRPVWTLRLKPARKHFPWKQLWIDKQACVILASRDWTSRNKVKRSMKTTLISYVGAQPSDKKLGAIRPVSRRAENPYVALKNARRASSRTAELPRYVPECFELVSVEVDEDSSDMQLTYSDGLYALSVFVGRTADQVGKRIRANRAYDWGQGLMFLARSQGRNTLIVADLPIKEIEKIAGSVQ